MAEEHTQHPRERGRHLESALENFCTEHRFIISTYTFFGYFKVSVSLTTTSFLALYIQQDTVTVIEKCSELISHTLWRVCYVCTDQSLALKSLSPKAEESSKIEDGQFLNSQACEYNTLKCIYTKLSVENVSQIFYVAIQTLP